MQDDQIGPKIVGLAPADMARLPSSIITKKISSKQPSPWDGTAPMYFELALLYKENRLFLFSF
jgi:hypothetical protein